MTGKVSSSAAEVAKNLDLRSEEKAVQDPKVEKVQKSAAALKSRGPNQETALQETSSQGAALKETRDIQPRNQALSKEQKTEALTKHEAAKEEFFHIINSGYQRVLFIEALSDEASPSLLLEIDPQSEAQRLPLFPSLMSAEDCMQRLLKRNGIFLASSEYTILPNENPNISVIIASPELEKTLQKALEEEKCKAATKKPNRLYPELKKCCDISLIPSSALAEHNLQLRQVFTLSEKTEQVLARTKVDEKLFPAFQHLRDLYAQMRAADKLEKPLKEMLSGYLNAKAERSEGGLQELFDEEELPEKIGKEITQACGRAKPSINPQRDYQKGEKANTQERQLASHLQSLLGPSSEALYRKALEVHFHPKRAKALLRAEKKTKAAFVKVFSKEEVIPSAAIPTAQVVKSCYIKASNPTKSTAKKQPSEATPSQELPIVEIGGMKYRVRHTRHDKLVEDKTLTLEQRTQIYQKIANKHLAQVKDGSAFSSIAIQKNCQKLQTSDLELTIPCQTDEVFSDYQELAKDPGQKLKASSLDLSSFEIKKKRGSEESGESENTPASKTIFQALQSAANKAPSKEEKAEAGAAEAGAPLLKAAKELPPKKKSSEELEKDIDQLKHKQRDELSQLLGQKKIMLKKEKAELKLKIKELKRQEAERKKRLAELEGTLSSRQLKLDGARKELSSLAGAAKTKSSAAEPGS